MPLTRRHLIALGALASLPAAHAAVPLSFGVVPQSPPAELARLWNPLIEALAQRAGVALRFATAPDIPSFEARLAEGRYDLAYMNPYHYTVFHQRPGYRAFAAEAGRRLRGIIVVPADSPLQGLDALQGRTLAFPSPGSFAATVLPLAEMARARHRHHTTLRQLPCLGVPGGGRRPLRGRRRCPGHV